MKNGSSECGTHELPSIFLEEFDGCSRAPHSIPFFMVRNIYKLKKIIVSQLSGFLKKKKYLSLNESKNEMIFFFFFSVS